MRTVNAARSLTSQIRHNNLYSRSGKLMSKPTEIYIRFSRCDYHFAIWVNNGTDK